MKGKKAKAANSEQVKKRPKPFPWIKVKNEIFDYYNEEDEHGNYIREWDDVMPHRFPYFAEQAGFTIDDWSEIDGQFNKEFGQGGWHGGLSQWNRFKTMLRGRLKQEQLIDWTEHLELC